jgi:hypothetical protein
MTAKAPYLIRVMNADESAEKAISWLMRPECAARMALITLSSTTTADDVAAAAADGIRHFVVHVDAAAAERAVERLSEELPEGRIEGVHAGDGAMIYVICDGLGASETLSVLPFSAWMGMRSPAETGIAA